MAKKSVTPLALYVDTNFLLDCTEGRNTHSVVLMEHLREKKLNVVSSTLTLMELCDTVKETIFVSRKLQQRWTLSHILREKYKPDLNQNDFGDLKNYVVNKALAPYPFVNFLTLTQEGWNAALACSLISNISAPDVVHLATAYDADCDVLVTSDTHFTKEVKRLIEQYAESDRIRLWLRSLKIYTPAAALSELKKAK
jgi:predicted nucleic acid-binding protein